jgi:hypothetical protein
MSPCRARLAALISPMPPARPLSSGDEVISNANERYPSYPHLMLFSPPQHVPTPTPSATAPRMAPPTAPRAKAHDDMNGAGSDVCGSINPSRQCRACTGSRTCTRRLPDISRLCLDPCILYVMCPEISFSSRPLAVFPLPMINCVHFNFLHMELYVFTLFWCLVRTIRTQATGGSSKNH